MNCLIRLQVIIEYQAERPPVQTKDFPHIRVISLWVSWNAPDIVLGYENSTNYLPRVWYEPSDSHTMNGEIQLLVTDDPIEFGKLVEVKTSWQLRIILKLIRNLKDHNI